jgi:hypothetical protein
MKKRENQKQRDDSRATPPHGDPLRSAVLQFFTQGDRF